MNPKLRAYAFYMRPLIALPVMLMLASPSRAQMDPSGTWRPIFHEDFDERLPGPEIGDYVGIPINAAARLKADSWMASSLELIENQCRPHPYDYVWRGPADLRIWTEYDRYTQKLIAYHVHGEWQQPEWIFWMDGRGGASEYEQHTWQGYSTANWDGNTLHVITDHLREAWLRRNGLNRSDYATVSAHMMRHGSYMAVAVITYDPVYLTAPFIRTTDYVLDNQRHIDPYPCEPQLEAEHGPGVIPHYLPGTNPYLSESAQKAGIPPEAARGGRETMYPEYIKKMESMKRLPRPERHGPEQERSRPP
jgi:hypothetical protein